MSHLLGVVQEELAGGVAATADKIKPGQSIVKLQLAPGDWEIRIAWRSTFTTSPTIPGARALATVVVKIDERTYSGLPLAVNGDDHEETFYHRSSQAFTVELLNGSEEFTFGVWDGIIQGWIHGHAWELCSPSPR